MRTKETIEREIELTRKRLDYYIGKEAEILNEDVQQYTIGSRSLQRRQISLKNIQDMIDRLTKKLEELEAEFPRAESELSENEEVVSAAEAETEA